MLPGVKSLGMPPLFNGTPVVLTLMTKGFALVTWILGGSRGCPGNGKSLGGGGKDVGRGCCNGIW